MGKSISFAKSACAGDLDNTQNGPKSVAEMFSCFSKLPAELQLEIWKKATRSGQVIKISTQGRQPFACKHHTRALYATCRDAQNAVKMYCTIVLHGVVQGFVYINPDVDVIAFEHWRDRAKLADTSKPFFCHARAWRGIKNLAYCNFDDIWIFPILEAILDCTNLKQLYLVNEKRITLPATQHVPPIIQSDSIGNSLAAIDCVQSIKDKVTRFIKTQNHFARFFVKYCSDSDDPDEMAFQIPGETTSFLDHPLVKSFEAPQIREISLEELLSTFL